MTNLTRGQHYREAERLIDLAAESYKIIREGDETGQALANSLEVVTQTIELAQVHATLATVPHEVVASLLQSNEPRGSHLGVTLD